jgi:hypothetical protein
MKLTAAFRHYVLVRLGMLPPRGSDHRGTGLQRREVEAIQALFHFSRMRSFDDFVVREQPQADFSYQKIRAKARRWSIHVSEVDQLSDLGREALGKVYSYGRRPGMKNLFPSVPDSIKHVVLIRSQQPSAAKYGTLLHELSHIFLGHAREGREPDYEVREAEAEFAAYVACRRNEIDIAGDTVRYLNQYVTRIDELHWPQLRRIGRAVMRLDRLRLLPEKN